MRVCVCFWYRNKKILKNYNFATEKTERKPKKLLKTHYKNINKDFFKKKIKEFKAN